MNGTRGRRGELRPNSDRFRGCGRGNVAKETLLTFFSWCSMAIEDARETDRRAGGQHNRKEVASTNAE